jgi:hypothetical protein
MVDGELDPEKTAVVQEHLRLCTTCKANLDGLRTVKQAAVSLPQEISPPRDLWEGIENRLQVRRTSRSWWNPAAAAVAATIVAAVALAFFLSSNRMPAPTIDGGASKNIHAHAAYESATVDSVRAEYEQARTNLLTVIEARRHDVAPETLEVIEHNMEVIDQAIADIELALATSPGEARLNRQLQLAYQQQIELLQWAARLSA